MNALAAISRAILANTYYLSCCQIGLCVIACGPAQQGMFLPSVDKHVNSCLYCHTQSPLTNWAAASAAHHVAESVNMSSHRLLH